MGKITVKEIVKKYLKAKGYTGLVGDECGCEIKDLMPCEWAFQDCEPGYKRFCEECKMKEECEIEGGYCDGGDYCINVSKGAPKGDK